MVRLRVDQEEHLSWLRPENQTGLREGRNRVGTLCDVEVRLNDGSLLVHSAVLASLSDFLRELLLAGRAANGEQQLALVVPGLRVNDLRVVLDALFRPAQWFRRSKKVSALRRALRAVSGHLRLDPSLLGTDSRGSERDQQCEYSSSGGGGGASLCLSDVDMMGLSDAAIDDNFRDQDARLVCLVCYKIFAAGQQMSFRRHVAAHDNAALKRVKLCNGNVVRRSEDCEEAAIVDPPQEVKTLPVEAVKLPPKPPPPPPRTPKRKREPPDTTCKECGKTFVDTTRLQVHQRIHRGERPFSCPQCDKSFTQRRTLEEHQRTHLDPSRTGLRCPDCPQDRFFVQRNHLRTHRASVHGLGDALSRCRDCHRVFAFPFQLAMHRRRVHSGQS